MSTYVGDFVVGRTVRKMWNSNAVAGDSITRATNGTVSVYKDGGTTQSTAGVTDTEDFDALTGVHLVAIDTSADGTFYSAGSDFEVVLSSATIDGKSINATLFAFSLQNRSVSAVPTATQNADALLARDLGSGSNAGTTNERTVRSALRFLRNLWIISSGTLTVKKEDDSTTAWTGAVSTASSDAVSGIDPA